jgi:hypothetical protein
MGTDRTQHPGMVGLINKKEKWERKKKLRKP